MTRIFTFLAALMLAAAGAVAETVTASGTIVTKPVSLPSQSIYELRTQTAIDIEYTQSATVKAELEAPANLFEYIKIEVSNSVLSVRYKDNTQIRNSKKNAETQNNRSGCQDIPNQFRRRYQNHDRPDKQLHHTADCQLRRRHKGKKHRLHRMQANFQLRR